MLAIGWDSMNTYNSTYARGFQPGLLAQPGSVRHHGWKQSYIIQLNYNYKSHYYKVICNWLA